MKVTRKQIRNYLLKQLLSEAARLPPGTVSQEDRLNASFQGSNVRNQITNAYSNNKVHDIDTGPLKKFHDSIIKSTFVGGDGKLGEDIFQELLKNNATLMSDELSNYDHSLNANGTLADWGVPFGGATQFPAFDNFAINGSNDKISDFPEAKDPDLLNKNTARVDYEIPLSRLIFSSAKAAQGAGGMTTNSVTPNLSNHNFTNSAFSQIADGLIRSLAFGTVTSYNFSGIIQSTVNTVKNFQELPLTPLRSGGTVSNPKYMTNAQVSAAINTFPQLKDKVYALQQILMTIFGTPITNDTWYNYCNNAITIFASGGRYEKLNLRNVFGSVKFKGMGSQLILNPAGFVGNLSRPAPGASGKNMKAATIATLAEAPVAYLLTATKVFDIKVTFSTTDLTMNQGMVAGEGVITSITQTPPGGISSTSPMSFSSPTSVGALLTAALDQSGERIQSVLIISDTTRDYLDKAETVVASVRQGTNPKMIATPANTRGGISTDKVNITTTQVATHLQLTNDLQIQYIQNQIRIYRTLLDTASDETYKDFKMALQVLGSSDRKRAGAVFIFPFIEKLSNFYNSVDNFSEVLGINSKQMLSYSLFGLDLTQEPTTPASGRTSMPITNIIKQYLRSGFRSDFSDEIKELFVRIKSFIDFINDIDDLISFARNLQTQPANMSANLQQFFNLLFPNASDILELKKMTEASDFQEKIVNNTLTPEERAILDNFSNYVKEISDLKGGNYIKIFDKLITLYDTFTRYKNTLSAGNTATLAGFNDFMGVTEGPIANTMEQIRSNHASLFSDLRKSASDLDSLLSMVTDPRMETPSPLTGHTMYQLKDLTKDQKDATPGDFVPMQNQTGQSQVYNIPTNKAQLATQTFTPDPPGTTNPRTALEKLQQSSLVDPTEFKNPHTPEIHKLMKALEQIETQINNINPRLNSLTKNTPEYTSLSGQLNQLTTDYNNIISQINNERQKSEQWIADFSSRQTEKAQLTAAAADQKRATEHPLMQPQADLPSDIDFILKSKGVVAQFQSELQKKENALKVLQQQTAQTSTGVVFDQSIGSSLVNSLISLIDYITALFLEEEAPFYDMVQPAGVRSTLKTSAINYKTQLTTPDALKNLFEEIQSILQQPESDVEIKFDPQILEKGNKMTKIAEADKKMAKAIKELNKEIEILTMGYMVVILQNLSAGMVFTLIPGVLMYNSLNSLNEFLSSFSKKGNIQEFKLYENILRELLKYAK